MPNYHAFIAHKMIFVIIWIKVKGVFHLGLLVRLKAHWLLLLEQNENGMYNIRGASGLSRLRVWLPCVVC